MKKLFSDTETIIKTEVGSILEKPPQRHNQREQLRRFSMNQDDCENENCDSTEFSHIQKKFLTDMPELLEQYCNILPVYGFKIAKYDLS